LDSNNPSLLSQEEVGIILLRIGGPHIPPNSPEENLFTAKAKQEIAPAEAPTKKSNFSRKEIPNSFSRRFKKGIEARVLTPPPSRERIYLIYKLNLNNYKG
jgi:hypothetical protein